MIVVADSSVLIPLDCGRLAHLLRAIGLDVRLSSLMIHGEMKALLLANRGLTYGKETLSKQEILELQEVRAANARLSVPDVSAFLVARRLEAILLTDDKRLVELARRWRVRCEGLVWCLDAMHSGGVCLVALSTGIASIQRKEPTNSPEELTSRRERYQALSDAQSKMARRTGAREGEKLARSAWRQEHHSATLPRSTRFSRSPPRTRPRSL